MMFCVNNTVGSNKSVECLLFAETRDITVPIPSDLNQALDRKSQGIPAFRDAQRQRARLAQELSRAMATQRKAEMNARFWDAVKKALAGAGASDPDVQELLNDPYFNSLTHFDNLPPTDQDRLVRERPETVDLTEAIDDVEYDVRELTKWLDSPVKRFIDEVAIPVITIGSIFIGDMFCPWSTPVTAPALVASCARLAPVMGRVAVAMGANEIYQQVTKLFNEQFKDDKSKKTERRGLGPDSTDTFWRTKLKDVKNLGVKRDFKGKGEIKTDDKMVFVRDRFHSTQKRHLESYVDTGKGWRAHAEHDPVTGEVIKGSIEKFLKKPRIIRRK